MGGGWSTERWWAGRNHLLLIVPKTRAMEIKFRRKTTVSQPLCILREDVVTVEDYKYLASPSFPLQYALQYASNSLVGVISNLQLLSRQSKSLTDLTPNRRPVVVPHCGSAQKVPLRTLLSNRYNQNRELQFVQSPHTQQFLLETEENNVCGISGP